MASKKIHNERVVERNITTRCDGFSFRVRLTIHGARIDETFDSLTDARAYRDRMRADATTDPTHRLVLEAKQTREDSVQITLTAMLDRYLREVTPEKRGARVESAKIGKVIPDFTTPNLSSWSRRSDTVYGNSQEGRVVGQ